MGSLNYEADFIKVFENYTTIKIHKLCLREIIDYTNRSGDKKKFIIKLKAQLDQLEESGTVGFEHPRGKNCNGIYSMKFKGIKNIRIFFSKEVDGTILLRAFEEKSDKFVSSYEPNLAIAQQRRKDLNLKGGSINDRK